jgi:hypothetical protein
MYVCTGVWVRTWKEEKTKEREQETEKAAQEKGWVTGTWRKRNRRIIGRCSEGER